MLGATFNEDPCNWDTQFEHMLGKANTTLNIFRVCKCFGYSLPELTVLFDSLIMSLFLNALESKYGPLPTRVNTLHRLISFVGVLCDMNIYLQVYPNDQLHRFKR